MKQLPVESPDLKSSVIRARRGRVVITRHGRPLALLVGVAGLDSEQLSLGADSRFWKLIEQRRAQKTVTRAHMEQELRKRK
jgi:prevent-host-death family protein